jgi:tRNA(Ile)-lysidine synthase
VAVSGGLDSMVLLQALATLAGKHRWKLVVGHFNHRLRGRSSEADERAVSTAAKKLKLPFVSESADVRGYAREHGFSLEMAGRKLRHGFLAETARKRGIRTIALAHHADDQVELFFLRLLRGAGSEGLAGMKWKSPSPSDARIQLIRPMLDRTKDELRAYAREQGVVFREDATNARLDMQRNRVRRELIPLLTGHYQPALRRVILRTMEVLGTEAEFIKSAAREWAGKGLKFEKLPVAMQRQFLQAKLVELGVGSSFGLIEGLRDAANCPIVVGEGTAIYRDEAGKVHAREVTRAGAGFDGKEKRVKLEGRAGEANLGKTRVYWEIRRGDTGTFRAGKRGENCECFDANKAGKEIILRHWRPGDRYQPLGMARAVKLQDIFVNQKIPRAERHRRIVATTAEGVIFWVEGLRMAERFKLDGGTKVRLKWRWGRV